MSSFEIFGRKMDYKNLFIILFIAMANATMLVYLPTKKTNSGLNPRD